MSGLCIIITTIRLSSNDVPHFLSRVLEVFKALLFIWLYSVCFVVLCCSGSVRRLSLISGKLLLITPAGAGQ